MLDASALMCVTEREPGADQVAAMMSGAVIGAVNLSEVIAKMRERGASARQADAVIAAMDLDVRPFTAAQARYAGHLRPATRALGLAFSDRACLALAAELRATALTADRQWAKLTLDIPVEVVR